MTIKTTIAVTAIICLLIGGAAGYYGRSLIRQNRGFGPTGTRGMLLGQNARMLGSGRVTGQVQSIADGRLTIQTPNNNSQIVLVNGSTSYQKMTAGSAGDVTTGTQVLVLGQQNPDGSTTATSIQIIPEGTNFPFGSRQGSQSNQN